MNTAPASLLSVLIGAFLGYRLGLHNLKYKVKIDAGKRFRDAFTPELTRVREEPEFTKSYAEILGPLAALPFFSDSIPLDAGPAIRIHRLIRESFSKHSQAVTEFENYLEGKKKDRFIQKWEYYRSDFINQIHESKNPRQDFLDTVNSLLKFTE